LKKTSLIILILSLIFLSNSTLAASEKRTWISLGADALNLINSQPEKQLALKQVSTTKLSANSNEDISVVSIPESQLPALSELMHENFNRCAGFFYHKSLDEALTFNKNSASLKTTQTINYVIDNDDAVNGLLSQLSESNLRSTISNLSNFNNRYYRSQSGVDSTVSIFNSWQNIATTTGRDDISVAYYNHPDWIQPSVMATINGTTLSDEYVIVGGHLDSINGSSPSNGSAPGADDNASGIAVITELLNMIASSDFRPARTVILIGYAAEEVGLRGSQEIARSFYNDNKNVVGVAQFDMTSFYGTQGKDIVFITDYTNELQNQFMADLATTYLPDINIGYDDCGYACSDHASWTNFGFPASFPFEATMNNSNRNIHTPNDTEFDVAHVIKFTRLAGTYVAELAKGEMGNNQPTGALQFSVSNFDVDEGNNISLTINRIAGSNLAVSVDFSTVDDTAIAGTDYTASSGTLNWNNQDNAAKTIVISTSEVSQDKSFKVLLSNPQGGAILSTQNTAVVTINNVGSPNNEPPPASSSGGGLFHPLLLLLILLIGKPVIRF